MRIKLTIAYDGTAYCGWQVQPDTISIQTIIQKALQTILRHPIELTGASRTDAGVHALGQIAQFDTEAPIDLSNLCYSTNALLPPDIRILMAEIVPADFHVRYNATGKIYHYHLHLDPFPDPFTRLYSVPVYGAFDHEAFRNAAKHFIGTYDFIAFANESDRGIAARDSIRTLQRFDIIEQDGQLRLELEGDGFLYKMVRNIVGTLLDIGAGRRSSDEIPLLLKMKNRKLSGPTAPARGLFLIEVKYAKNDLQVLHQTIQNAQSLQSPSPIKDNEKGKSIPVKPEFVSKPADHECCPQIR